MLTDAIQSFLEGQTTVGHCVACSRTCRSARDIQVDHPDFYMTLPLRICRHCSTQPPFPELPVISRYRRTVRRIADWILPRKGVGSSGLEQDGSHATTLQSLFEKVPEYRALARCFPQITLSPREFRDFGVTSEESERTRFDRSSYWRRSTTFLMTAEDAERTRLPETLLTVYPDLVDDGIQRVMEKSTDTANVVIFVAAVLLPNRAWHFDIQVSTAEGNDRHHPLVARVRESLQGIPGWSIAYPLAFVVRRSFGCPPAGAYSQLLQPFELWSRREVRQKSITFCEMALAFYEVKAPDSPPEFSLEECEELCRYSPHTVALQLLRASALEHLGRSDEELDLYDRLITEFPDHFHVIHKRILCLTRCNQLERAAAACQQRMKSHPDDVAACALLASLQLNLNHPEECLKQIDDALKIQRSAAFYRIRAEALAALSRFDEALTSANVAIFSDFNCGSAYLLRAKLHLRADRQEQALQDLADYERCSGVSHESLHLKTDLLVALKRVGEAESTLRQTLAEVPDNVALRLQWVEFLGQIGKLESARQECDQIIKESDQVGVAYSLRAAILLEMGQFDDAIQDADRAIELSTDAPKAYMIRGLAKAALGHVSDGLEDLDVCVDQAPDLAIGRFHRARLRVGLEEFSSAVDEFTAALEIIPDWIEALMERGYVQLNLDDHHAARDDFERVIELAPDRTDGYTGRALTFLIERKKGAAYEDLNKAIELDPSNLAGRLNRARLLLEQAEVDRALEDLNAVLVSEPLNSPALWQRAYVNLYLGHFDEARKDFDQVHQANPEAIQSLIGRSVAFEFMGDLAKAEADREEARRLEPFSAEQQITDQFLLTAQVASRNEQFDRAIELATKVIDEQVDPPWEAYRTRGHAHWYSENFVEALEDYSHIIDNSDEATRHDYSAYGQILGELGEFEKALESLDRSIEIAQEEDDRVGLAYSLNGRGRALAGMGRVAEAEEAFTESFRLKPDNAWLHFNRGLMYVEQNDPVKAVDCYEQSLRVSSPKIPPAKRRRATGFIDSTRKT